MSNQESITFEESYIKTEYGNYAIKSCGNKDNEVIVCLHGWLDNANSFDYMAPFFEKDYYCISIDLPGHGKTFHRDPKTPSNFINYVFDLKHILKALNSIQIHLIGHSMGGGIATLYASTFPEDILTLHLLDAPGPLSRNKGDIIKQLKSSYNQYENLKKRTRIRYESLEQAAELRKEINKIEFEHALSLVSRNLKKEDEHYYWLTDPRLMILSPLTLTENQVESFIKNIECPVLFFQAMQSTTYPQELVQYRCSLFHNLKRFEINAPHHLHMTNAEEVSKIILNFLKTKNWS